MSDNNSVEAKLDETILRALKGLENILEYDDNYAATVTQISNLSKIRHSFTPEAAPVAAPESKWTVFHERIKPWVPVIGSAVGIALVGILEIKGHSMASKASGFITKMK